MLEFVFGFQREVPVGRGSRFDSHPAILQLSAGTVVYVVCNYCLFLVGRMHRALMSLLLVPILLTSSTGVLHPMLRSLGVPDDQIKRIIREYSGNFMVVNLMPIYPFLVGIIAFVLAITGW